MNRIEKEVLEAEYENWLLDETQRCERVRVMLNEEGDGEKSKDKDKSKGKGKEVEEWVRGYCGDCERALKGVGRIGAGKGLM